MRSRPGQPNTPTHNAALRASAKLQTLGRHGQRHPQERARKKTAPTRPQGIAIATANKAVAGKAAKPRGTARRLRKPRKPIRTVTAAPESSDPPKATSAPAPASSRPARSTWTTTASRPSWARNAVPLDGPQDPKVLPGGLSHERGRSIPRRSPCATRTSADSTSKSRAASATSTSRPTSLWAGSSSTRTEYVAWSQDPRQAHHRRLLGRAAPRNRRDQGRQDPRDPGPALHRPQGPFALCPHQVEAPRSLRYPHRLG